MFSLSLLEENELGVVADVVTKKLRCSAEATVVLFREAARLRLSAAPEEACLQTPRKRRLSHSSPSKSRRCSVNLFSVFFLGD